MLDWLKTYAMAGLGIALALALACAGLQTVRLAQLETQFANHKTRVANIRAHQEEQHAIDQAAARITEQTLAAEADTTRKEKHEAVTTLERRVAALSERLRLERADRPAASGSEATPPASPGPGSTGAGLYRQDGIFLVGEAASAAQVGIERDACRKLYSQARDLLGSTP